MRAPGCQRMNCMSYRRWEEDMSHTVGWSLHRSQADRPSTRSHTYCLPVGIQKLTSTHSLLSGATITIIPEPDPSHLDNSSSEIKRLPSAREDWMLVRPALHWLMNFEFFQFWALNPGTSIFYHRGQHSITVVSCCVFFFFKSLPWFQAFVHSVTSWRHCWEVWHGCRKSVTGGGL